MTRMVPVNAVREECRNQQLYRCTLHGSEEHTFFDELYALWLPVEMIERVRICNGNHARKLDQLRVAGDFWRAMSIRHEEAKAERAAARRNAGCESAAP